MPGNDPRTVLGPLTNLVTQVDEASSQIVRVLGQNTPLFYRPDSKGPDGPVDPQPPEKLRIATIANDLRAPLRSKDLPPNLIPFDPVTHLEHAKTLANDGETYDAEMTDVFKRLDSTTFSSLKMLTFEDDFDLEEYMNQIEDRVQKLIDDYQVHAVCFAELAYPYPGHKLDLYGKFREFEERLQTIADAHQVIIIGGSYHCLKSQTNECAIFIPLDRHTRTNEIVTKTKNVSPRYYTKRVPAQKAEEVVRRPPNIDFPYYTSNFGHFGVLVCFDTFDPTLFLRLLAWHHDSFNPAQGNNKPYLDVIFVPSYSGNSYGWDIAVNLSYVTRSIVVYVDGPFDSTRFGVAVCGTSVRESIPHNIIVEEHDFAVWEIDRLEFKQSQRDIMDAQDSSPFWQILASEKRYKDALLVQPRLG